jgi:hypothetical protein
MHPLDGPRLKIRRAVSQISLLRDAQLALWKDSKHKVVRAELNPKTGNYVYRAKGDFALSLDWGVSIGEIAHNLRSALDGVLYQVAIVDEASAEALAQTEFPIFLIRYTKRRRRRRPGKGKPPLIPHFERDGREKIKGLSDEHQAMIEGLQPYHRRSEDGAKGRTHPLYWLQQINNADKHRVIQIVGFQGSPSLGAWVGSDTDDPFQDVAIKRLRVLKNGAKVLEAPAHVVVNPSILPLVAFAEGSIGVKNRWVVGTLQRAADTVAGIIEKFAPVFENRS